MDNLNLDSNTEVAPAEPPSKSSKWLALGLAVCFASIGGLAYYDHQGRAALQTQIADSEHATADRLTKEIAGVKAQNASLASDVMKAVQRLTATDEQLAATTQTATTLQQANAKVTKTADANTTAVTTLRKNTDAQFADVNSKVGDVSASVKTVTSDLAATRHDLEAGQRDMSAVTTKLSDEIAKNGADLSALRRKDERDVLDFDIRKGSRPESWTVAGIRIELKDTDVKKSKYSVILHVNDRLLEEKDRTMNVPLQFFVGPEHVRYELVVESVQKDRIKGYVSIPKGAQAGLKVS